MNQHYLQLYADFIVKVGVNVQPRQNFIIRCPVTMPEFGHACVKAGYEAGAKNCIVRWEDDKLSRLHYEYAKEEDLAAMKPYELRSYLDYAEDPDGCCTLAIHALTLKHWPGWMPPRSTASTWPRRKFLKTLAGIHDERPCTVVCGRCFRHRPGPQKSSPASRWRKRWKSCGHSSLMSAAFPPATLVSAWKAHVAEGRRHRDQLNAWNLDHIHMTSSNGTDLTVGLADDGHLGGRFQQGGKRHRFYCQRAHRGSVLRTPPRTGERHCVRHQTLCVQRQLIEGWHVTFKDGKSC